MRIVKVRKCGNSYINVIPKEILDALNLKSGDEVIVRLFNGFIITEPIKVNNGDWKRRLLENGLNTP